MVERYFHSIHIFDVQETTKLLKRGELMQVMKRISQNSMSFGNKKMNSV